MDLTGAAWRTSSYSGDNGGNCVEVGATSRSVVAVRDSTNPSGPALTFTSRAWTTFAEQLKASDCGR
jgi:hypothetical protein